MLILRVILTVVVVLLVEIASGGLIMIRVRHRDVSGCRIGGGVGVITREVSVGNMIRMRARVIRRIVRGVMGRELGGVSRTGRCRRLVWD